MTQSEELDLMGRPAATAASTSHGAEAYVLACLIRGEWVRALAVIEELGPASGYAPHLAVTAGRLLHERRYADAALVAEKAVEMDPACPAAHNALGQVLWAAAEQEGDHGRSQGAEAALRHAAELDADAVPPRVTLASLLTRQGRWREARELLAESLALEPEAVSTREALKRLRKAVETAGRCARGEPSAGHGGDADPTALAQLADELRRLAAQRHQGRSAAARPADATPTVSLCLITRDEARNLTRVVESVRGLATEIVVVDTGSTDETVRIAQRLKARVESIPWVDDFAAARNHSLALAAGDWLLVLDADDEFDRASIPELRRWLARAGDVSVVGLYRRYPHPDMQKDSVSIQPRLFRNHRGLRYEGAIHERLVHADARLAEPDITLTAMIHHHGAISGPDATARRRVRNGRILRQVLERDPDDLRARFYLGLTCFEGEGWHEAIPHLQAVVENASEEWDFIPKAYACLGNALLNADRALDAETALLEGLRRFPQHPELWFCLGLVRDSLGQLDEAVAAHEAALRGRFGPSLNWHDWACRDAKPHLALCDLRLALGDPAAAARHLGAAEQSAGPQPCHAGIRAVIDEALSEQAARLAERQRLLESAEAEFVAGDPNAGLRLVELLMESGLIDSAAQRVETWLQSAGEIPEALVAQGNLLLGSGSAEQALLRFVQARDLDPGLVTAWQGEAEACRCLDRWEQAEAALRATCTAAGEEAVNTRMLGEYLLDRRSFEEAACWLQKSLELRDDAWPAWLALGRCMLATGNLPSAVHCFQRAATLSSGNAAVRRALGDARLWLLRQRERAASESIPVASA